MNASEEPKEDESEENGKRETGAAGRGRPFLWAQVRPDETPEDFAERIASEPGMARLLGRMATDETEETAGGGMPSTGASGGSDAEAPVSGVRIVDVTEEALRSGMGYVMVGAGKPEPDAQGERRGFLLTSEAGLHEVGPEWTLVESVVRGLDEGEGNSFCCLEDSGGSYVQTLRGLNGWHLEWRAVSDPVAYRYLHQRASVPGGATRAVALEKLDGGNAGELRDLLSVAEVLEVFRLFFAGENPALTLEWREIEL